MSHIHEECGVFAVYDKSGETGVKEAVYSALYALQHRGQESCGIAVNENGNISCYRDLGLVNDVFTKEAMSALPQNGKMAIGHCRYASAGKPRRSDAQPMLIRHINGSMSLAFNGALTNAEELRRKLEMDGGIFHTTTDAEVIAYVIIRQRLKKPSLEEAVIAAMDELEGAYSLVVMNHEKIIAVRDYKGFRPLCLGQCGDAYMVASESCALDAVDASFVRDIKPGEVVIIDESGVKSIQAKKSEDTALCVFEYVYFARPDSVIDGVSVHEARRRAGAFLAKEHPVDADVVIGVPDSGIDAAIGYAEESGIPYGMGFIKNKYIGRTFIQPNQKLRENTVRIKLNPIASTVKGKRVVLIDDSIVRGTTSLKIVNLLREAGAAEVHFRASSPEFLYPCYFGTDVPDRDSLIAVNHTTQEVAEMIGVDSLGFLSVDSVRKIAEGASCGFCTGCFTGKYPINCEKCVK